MAGDCPECSQLNPKFGLSRPVYSRANGRSELRNGRFHDPGEPHLPAFDRELTAVRPSRRTAPNSQPIRKARRAGADCRSTRRVNSGDEFGDHLDPASRDVRDHAVSRQRAGPKLDLGDPSTLTTFACASIHQHVDPQPCSIFVPAFPIDIAKKCWKLPSGIVRN